MVRDDKLSARSREGTSVARLGISLYKTRCRWRSRYAGTTKWEGGYLGRRRASCQLSTSGLNGRREMDRTTSGTRDDIDGSSKVHRTQFPVKNRCCFHYSLRHRRPVRRCDPVCLTLLLLEDDVPREVPATVHPVRRLTGVEGRLFEQREASRTPLSEFHPTTRRSSICLPAKSTRR